MTIGIDPRSQAHLGYINSTTRANPNPRAQAHVGFIPPPFAPPVADGPPGTRPFIANVGTLMGRK